MKKLITLLFVFILIILLTLIFVHKDKAPIQEIINIDNIENYQAQYWDIIKRNNVLIQIGEDSEEFKKDREDLAKLYSNLTNKISKDNDFIKKLNKIEDDYEKNIKNAQTQLEMNNVADKYLIDTDKVLNEIYKKIRNSVDEDEFNTLKENQRIWLKEIKEYEKIIDKQGFGSISPMIYSSVIQDIKKFRTILLILYYSKNNIPKLDDYLGSWDEIIAGRIYINIENKGNNIEVKYGGANSAYSHSETAYKCRYDISTGDLICNGAKHQDQFLSCKGKNSEDEMEEFMQCADENPDLVKDDYKTYYDEEKRVLSIEYGNKNHNVIDDEEYLSPERKKELEELYQNKRLYFKESNETFFYQSAQN